MKHNHASAWPPAVAADPEFRFAGGVSVFFPAYNDAQSLPSLLQRTFDTLARVATDYEVIVVNDGSTDNSAEILEELRRTYAPFLRVVSHAENRGYGAALRSGFAAATKEFIFYTDGDGQYDPAELENLLRAVTPSTGAVNGYKIERSDPWHRIAIGWLYNCFARWLFGIRLRDIDCDFRLIRGSALDLASLRSTGGTICVEIVRALELRGTTIAELPVHHYPRRHGRSQFFRVRSLVVTFLQLCGIFARLVLRPMWSGSTEGNPQFSRRQTILIAAILVLLSVMAYARSLTIPFISDDYLQIQLARDYGPIAKWAALSHDVLYRCRATSLVLTYWIDRVAGLDPLYYRVASLLLHIVCSFLVLALGRWRPIGWHVAALAAGFFAIGQRHSEAVIWFSAVPELLVFAFVLATFHLWIRCLDSRPFSRAYWAALGCFVLALLSKESAVVAVPLCALALFFHPGRPLVRLWELLPFAVLGSVYFGLIYTARGTHYHFHDGTFALNAPFLETIARSMGGMIRVWGAVFVPILLTKAGRPWRKAAFLAAIWMAVALLPYSFLMYMPRVPSRHTYLASVGQSLLIAAGLLALRECSKLWNRAWLVPAAASLILLHQFGYLWVVKYRQYSQRAEPTEELVRVAQMSRGAVHASCFPYVPEIAELALQLRLNEKPRAAFMLGPLAARQPDAVDFCNDDANGAHY